LGGKWVMKIFEIFIAYISWSDGGKSRPVFVVAFDDDTVTIYQITTQYENKSNAIRKKYFAINDWQQAGLDRQSYVDTNDTFELPNSVIARKTPIGKLTVADELRLIEFLANQ
jgi:hypothetical protein